jgi:Asp-tRNA(Asn)/Glu-tRNA(Gln) amidotransferase C subunit
MGDTNVVSLLGRISMNLDKLVQMNAVQHTQQNQQKNITNALNSGTTVVSQTPKETKEKSNRADINISLTGMSPAQLTEFLSSLPKQILMIAALKKTTMKNFQKTFDMFADSMSSYNKVKISSESTNATKIITESLTSLDKIDLKKLSKELKTANSLGFQKLFAPTMECLINGLKLFEKIDNDKISGGIDAAKTSCLLLNTLVNSVFKVMANVILMAVAIKFIGGKEILKATGIVLGTLAALTGIAAGVMLLSKAIGKETMEGISSITGFIFKMQLLCLSTLLLGVVFEKASPQIKEGFLGISVMMMGYTAVIALSGLVAGLASEGIHSMKTIMLVAGIGVLLTAATLFLGVLVEGASEDITRGFIATAAMITGYTGIITVAARIAKKATITLTHFASIGAIAGGAMGLTYLTLKLGHAIKDEKDGISGEWMIAEGFAITSSILLGYTAIVRAASKISPVNMGKGALALAAIEGIAVATCGVVWVTSKLAKSIADAGEMNVIKTLGIAALMIGEFGILAGVAGALVFGPQAAIFAAGIAALASIDLLVIGTSKTMETVLDACKIIDGMKTSEGSTSSYVFDPLIDSFTTLVNDLAEMIGVKFIAKVTKISVNSKNIRTVSKVIGEVTTCMSGVALVAGPNGTIRSVSITDDGKFVYGEYVDIVSSSNSIAESFKTFTNKLLETFQSISTGKLIKTSVGVKIIGKLIEPVSLFAKTMLSFQDAGEGKIKEIRFNQDGSLVNTPEVDIKKVSDLIASSISTFATTLFSEQNQAAWERIAHGTITTNGEYITYAEKAMGVLATVISPVCEFVNTLTQFESGDNNTIVVPIYGENGTITSRRVVDVVNIANSISSAISKFASTLFSQNDMWANMYKPKTTQTKRGGIFSSSEYQTVNEMESAVGVFANIITPVVSFANILSKYGNTQKENTLIVYDANGKTREIDVVDIATKISSSVSTFVNTLTANLNVSDNEAATALANTTGSIQNLFNSFDNFIGDPKTNSITTFKVSVDGVSKSFKNFDKVLSDGTTNRVNSIKKLGEAFDDLKKKLSDAKSDLNEVKDIFESLNKADTSNINNVVEKISEKLKFTIDHTGTVSSADITNAIRSAVDGATLQEFTIGSGDSARRRFEMDLDGVYSH